MGKKLKVVVADDMEMIAKNIQSIVTANQNVEKVWIAFDGEEEIEKILEIEPDIVFTDNQMPKMTGIEVIEKIRKMELKKYPKFVLVTGDRSTDLMEKARELEFYIESKPANQYRINEYLDEFEYENERIKIEQNTSKKKKKESFLKRLFNRI